jgi:TPR repeat protein
MDKAEENQEALQWYRKAAEQGDANGQYGLGQMYAAGKGVAKDPVQGLNWMKQAASQGLLAAVVAVAQMLEHGDPKSIGDVKAALDYWRRAAELGDHGAMRRLAAAYRKGELGLQADPSQAQAWEARLAKAVGATPQPRKK